MIYRFRKKFIKICTLSFIGVFLVLFFSIYFLKMLLEFAYSVRRL